MPIYLVRRLVQQLVWIEAPTKLLVESAKDEIPGEAFRLLHPGMEYELDDREVEPDTQFTEDERPRLPWFDLLTLPEFAHILQDQALLARWKEQCREQGED